ncbi:MAG: isoprenylcysteine carboxylmethyltransferase family protein [Balneola sp.]
MKLKIPPVIVVAITAFLMWVIADYLSLDILEFNAPKWIIILTSIFGFLCIVLGIIQFTIKKTTVNPHKPEESTSLVNSGIYSISRNPMYLGMLIFLMFYGLFLGDGLVFLMLPIFIWYMNSFQIKPEEEMMIQLFGDEYKEYQQKVRRWI